MCVCIYIYKGYPQLELSPAHTFYVEAGPHDPHIVLELFATALTPNWDPQLVHIIIYIYIFFIASAGR